MFGSDRVCSKTPQDLVTMNFTCLRVHTRAQKAQVLQKPSELIPITFLFAFALCCLDAHLFVVLLQSCEILTCFAEFSFFHTLADIPMHEGALAVHEVKLVVNARKDLCDGSGV